MASSTIAPPNDPTLANSISSLNTAQNDYQTQSKALSDQLNTFTGQQQDKINNAYTGATDYGNLKSAQDSANKIQNALTGSQNASAAVVPQTNAAAQGSFANAQQVATQANTSNIPYAEQVARLSANLVPAENAVSSESNLVSNEAANTVTGAQLAEQGFTAGMQSQLTALQSKINSNQALTNDEYNSYAQLQAAQTQANASIQSAQIGANAQTGAAQISANASKYANALSNPGIKVSFDANGNPNGISYLNTPSTPDSKTPNGTDLNTLKSQLATQLVSNPKLMNGNDNAIIAQLIAQGGLSQADATNLYYQVRKPFESLINPPKQPTQAQTDTKNSNQNVSDLGNLMNLGIGF